jgi:hypothetical protein
MTLLSAQRARQPRRWTLHRTSAPFGFGVLRQNGAYVEHANAQAGEVLRLDEPIAIAFDPARLLRR